MAIEKRTRGEEILIRLNPEGIAGAHYQTIIEVVEDGNVLTANPGGLQQLSTVGDGEGSLAKLLGEVTSNALVQNEAYRNELFAASERNQELVQISEQQHQQMLVLSEHISEVESRNTLLTAHAEEQAKIMMAAAQEIEDLRTLVASQKMQLDAIRGAVEDEAEEPVEAQ